MTPQRIYIIGAGVIAHHHATAATKIPGGSEVVISVADPDPKRLAEFSKAFPEARFFDSAAAMLREECDEHDVVIVATPTHMHERNAIEAFRTGRHVLVEKPLGMNPLQAERMWSSAQEYACHLGCCSSRYLGEPTTREVRRILSTGQLGPITRILWLNRANRSRPGIEIQPDTPWLLERSKAGGGVLFEWGPFDFAQFHELLNPVRIEVLDAWVAHVDAGPDLYGSPYDVENQVGASLLFHLDDGSAVPIDYERSHCVHGSAHKVNQMEGTHGAVEWDWLMQGTKDVRVHYDEAGVPKERLVHLSRDAVDIHHKPLINFLRRIRGNRKAPMIMDETAVDLFRAVCAVYECASTRRRQSVLLRRGQ